jgi:hypothetical protein
MDAQPRTVACCSARPAGGIYNLKMADTQTRKLKFVYFLLGIAMPIAGYIIWCKTDGFGCGRKARVDRAHDVTVEDSFPASDPPSAW